MNDVTPSVCCCARSKQGCRPDGAISSCDARRILIVDDNRAIHEDFRKILSNPTGNDDLEDLDRAIFGAKPRTRQLPTDFRLDSAYQGIDALALVEKAVSIGQPYSLAFIDMRMPPGWDGLETIERLWAVDPDLQVVICSAYSDHDWGDIVGRLGRSDDLLVLKKPADFIEVLQCAHALTAKWLHERALRRQLDSLEREVMERTEKLRAANERLSHQSTHDILTGLPNRVLLDDRLSEAIAEAERSGKGFAVGVLDLDRFKRINDSLGHRAGDDLLKHVSHRLLTVVRSEDTVARVGGDEFVFIFRNAQTPEEAERLGTRIIDELRAPMRIGEIEVHPAASMGIAFYPGDGREIDTLYANADAAMYCAKHNGGCAVQCFEPSMNLASEDRVRYEADLHHALDLQQFELHYQPKVTVPHNRIHGAEALIRWRHPGRGLIAPDQFIPLAEESGLIVPMGEWVLREVCRHLRIWQDQRLPDVRVGVNVSALQFRRLKLVDIVRSALTDFGVSASSLEIELTESALMTHPQETAEVLARLSEMGVVVSIDNFGTGYSSISYLRRFPIDRLKIDRGFVGNLMASTDDASIVRAIISLAHSLRLKVVAEGVETGDQLAYLQSLGCDHYQGSYFSPPVSTEAFGEMLRSAQRATQAWTDDELSRTHSRLTGLQPK